jgi:hypothetical protein
MIWTEEKIEKLKELYPVSDNNYLSELLGIKKGTIVAKANALGIYKDPNFRKESRKKLHQCKRTVFTEDEEIFILNNYDKMTNMEISKALNKSKRSVMRKISRMGIKRAKNETDFLRAKIIKENSRDLSYDFIKKESLKYSTRSEFSYMDNIAYSKAKKFGWLEEFKHLKIGGSISIPQLILMDILERFLSEECRFNDRSAIKPLEIDCYFEKWKVGWEYNGKWFHKDESKDLTKKNRCSDLGITLFIIDEKSDNYGDYPSNIKSQLVKQISEIKRITGISIDEDELKSYVPKINFLFRLRNDEIEKCRGKKMSEIKELDNELYQKIKKYNLTNLPELEICNDLKKNKRFRDVNEHIEYLMSIKHNYKSFSELSMNEHLYRKVKFYGVSIDYIRDRVWIDR